MISSIKTIRYQCVYPKLSLNGKRSVILRTPFYVLLSLIYLIIGISGPSFADNSKLWKVLQSGNHFALLRHALAPGTGDPPQFALGKCSTQRNLSDEGRRQAERLGDRFRANGIEKARVFSSQWCRCLETAKLLALGSVKALPALNSFFQEYERQASQTQQLKQWIAGQDLDHQLVLVTHQVNITALTGVYPASGEIIIVRGSKVGEFSVAGSIQMD